MRRSVKTSTLGQEQALRNRTNRDGDDKLIRELGDLSSPGGSEQMWRTERLERGS